MLWTNGNKGERGDGPGRARPWRTGPTTRSLAGAEDGQVARVRLEVPGLFSDISLGKQIERKLLAIEGVVAARANPRTGRVLVRASVGSAEAVQLALSSLSVPGALPPPSLRRMVKDTAEGARSLVRRVRALAEGKRGGAASAEGRRNEAEGPNVGDGPPRHARRAAEVAASLGVDPQRGLDEPVARARLEHIGPNELAGVEARSRIEILAGQVFTVPTAILLGAAGLSLALGDALDAGAIALVIGSNAAIGYFTEATAEELLHAWGELRVEWTRVLRGGREQLLAASGLVPGDVIVLRAGEPVAADARVLCASELAADESMLTGESEPAEKSEEPVVEGTPLAERKGMVYAGTVIASGSGKAVVVATGGGTELGNIQRALSRANDRSPPLEQELAEIGRRLALMAIGSSAAVVGIGLLRGRPLRRLVRSAVALGVAAIPEGFPTVGTTALALASKRLRGRGIVIRRLAAAETLGAVSVICADKTGTLTENRMHVAELFVPGHGLLRVCSTGAEEAGASPGPGVTLLGEGGREVGGERLHDLARIMALNADVELDESGRVVRGSGTERALVEFAQATGYPVSSRRHRATRLREERRSAERAFMVTVHDHPELGHIELMKGAPEQVIARCEAASVRAEQVLGENSEMASRGLRVLALAWRRDGRGGDGSPMTFAGLVGLRDPPRQGVREALASLGRAGISTVMLTGDQERTALAIGRELGIAEEAVHSRVTPDAKLEIVKRLQQEGAIVAMTGDGVNDGPALKAADVGVAMGRRGTDIARAVADVVLAEDDLPSLIDAVREGRRLHDNVRRAIAYFVSTNMSEVLVMLAGAVSGVAPLTPLQLLWINLLTDVAPALALALEPAEPSAMRRPPRDPDDRLFSSAELGALGRDAAGMAVASLAAYAAGGRRSSSTMAFTSLVTAQLLHIRACRASPADRERGSSVSHENPYVGRALLGASALQVLAFSSGSLGRLLGTERMRAHEVALAVATGALPSLLGGGRRSIAPADRQGRARGVRP